MLRTLEFSSLLWGVGALLCNEALCPPEWVSSTQRGDSFCDLACMNGPCGYDGGAGSFSASDCRYELCYSWYFEDGMCTIDNSKAICGWDMGECGYCAEGCKYYTGFQENLSNGICEDQCNAAICGFDSGDCVSVTQGDCASGCFSSMLGNGICEIECSTADCFNDGGDCELCAPGCYPQMLGNFLCDDACNVAECSNDSGDCDCSPGCVLDLLANEECDEVCAFASCDFDFHLCVTFMQGDCASGCFQWMIGDGHCDLACNSAACEWDKLDCGCAPGCDFADIGTCKLECFLLQCNYGLGVDQLLTLFCADAQYWPYNGIFGYYHLSPCYYSTLTIKMNCCEGCCDWMRPSEFNQEVCVLDPDSSSASAPQVLYVSPDASPEADGSISHPCTLHSAFQRLYQAYTTFLLLPGVHEIKFTGSFIQKILSGDTYLPTVHIEKLVIIPRDCVAGSDTCVRVTLKYVEEEVFFNIQNVSYLDISYVDFYSPLQPLTCMYCIINLILFPVGNNRFVLSHVAFRHFHGLLKTVMGVGSGKIELTDVDFEDIVGNFEFATGAIYLNPGSEFSYIGGTVTLLNNGLRYGSTRDLFNILTSEFATLTVRNVTFSHNFAEAAFTFYSQTSLITLGVCKQCVFSHCVFRNNIANSIFRYQGNNIWNIRSHIRTLASNSIEFSDCEFANNTATFGTLSFFGTMHLPDVMIRNCTFTNELSASYGVVAIQAAKSALRNANSWKFSEENDRQVRVIFSVASAILTNLRFINCTVTEYGVIAITTFPQVLMSDVEIDSSGAFRGANRYSNTLQDFANFGGLIPDNVPLIPTASCASLLNFTSVHNLTIISLRSNAANCTLRLQASGDSMIMNFSTFSSVNPSEVTLLRLQFSQSVSVFAAVFEEIQCAEGSMLVTAGSLHLAASYFQENTKAVVVQSADSVIVEHTKFVRGQGNAIALYLATRGMHLEVRNCTFDGNVAGGENGIIAMLVDQNDVQVALLLTESQFLNSQVPLGSTLLFLQQLTFTDDSEISFCEFSNNTVGTLYIAPIAGSLRIADCVFTKNTGEIIYCECFQACLIDLNTLFFESNAGVAVTLRNSTAVAANLRFRMSEGACLDLTSTRLSASELSFANNSAEEGPALTLTGSQVILTNSTFHYNSAKTNGGAVLAQAGSEFNCFACTFESLSAAMGGAVFAKHESVVYLRHSRFIGNTAWDGFAVLLALSKLSSFIENSVFEGNSGMGSGVISLMSATLVLSSSVIRNNTSPAFSAGLVVQLAFVAMTHCEFSDQRSASGCFVYASHSEVRAEHSLFSAGSATASGGAILTSATNLTAENCTFHRLTAAAGAAIAMQSSSITALKDCHFTDTVTQSSSRGVIEVSESRLHLSGAHFEQFTDSAIVGEAAILDIVSSEFTDNEMASTGGGIACAACSNVTIASSLFTRLKADTGSAVYLQSDSISTFQWEIRDCVFSANTANAAATVWLKGARTRVSNTLFSENQAGDFGGGLALFDLFAELLNNSYISNRAHEGAAIYWRGTQPNTTDIECIGNVAEYGTCFSSFPVALRIEKNSTLTGLSSGQITSGGISILLVDHYGQVVSIDSSSDGWLVSGSNDTAVSGVTHTKAQKGRFFFKDFAIIAQPKSNASLLIYSSALNSSYPLEVEMRDCVKGEMLSGLQCIVCEAGTYSLRPSQPCKKCPPEAICLGNFTLTPRSGYWRVSEYTDHFFRCPNQDSCLGSPGPTTNLTGKCEEGYEGNKCQSCSIGYYRWGKVSCAKCPSVGVQVAVRLSIVAFVSILVIVIVRSALHERGVHSAYAKVYVNYLQLVMLLGSFHLQWPSIMLRLFNAQESIGAFLEIAFSLRCLWSGETESETYFHELIMFSLFPPALVLVSCCVWLLISLCKREILGFRSKVLGSAIVLYFLAYPSVVRVMASAWTLEEIGAGELWVAGLQQRALTGRHLKYAVALALPCGLLYGVLLPLALAFTLKRNTKAQKFHLGFFTQAYRPEMYYWKFVTVLRVALVVACISLFSRVSAAYQVLSALAVLSASLLLHRTCHPFANNIFNVLESRALIIVIMTLYAGLFFYAAKLNAIAEVALSAFMIAVNAYFSITCWRHSALTLIFTAASNISKWLKTRSIVSA